MTDHAAGATSLRTRIVVLTFQCLTIYRSFNPFSEAQFKTLKYRPEFPGRFGSIEDGRAFCRRFFRWYNDEHRHSGIGFHTPADVHFGRAGLAQLERVRVLREAYAAHPERFVRQAPVPPALPGPAWINKPVEVPPAP
jgi:putative transposase